MWVVCPDPEGHFPPRLLLLFYSLAYLNSPFHSLLVLFYPKFNFYIREGKPLCRSHKSSAPMGTFIVKWYKDPAPSPFRPIQGCLSAKKKKKSCDEMQLYYPHLIMVSSLQRVNSTVLVRISE